MRWVERQQGGASTPAAPLRGPSRASRIAVALLTLGAVAVTLAGCSVLPPGPAARNASDAPSQANPSANVFSITVGECLDDATASGTVTTAPIIPCSHPHNSEAYKSIEMADGSFPGDAAVQSAANEGCATAFPGFVGIPYDDSKLSISYYFPTAESWKNGDRQIMCTVYDAGRRTTGTLKNAKR